MVLSICIPTYNRGKNALNLVRELLPLLSVYKDELEIIVSNNGSERGIYEYNEIKNLKIDNLTYYEFDKNMQYVGNYNQVIKLSKADFCLLISDEDRIDRDAIDFYMSILKNNPDLGLIRAASSNFYSAQIENKYLKAGKEAVNDYFLRGNYISGIIYNRKIVTDEVVDKLYEKYLIENKNRSYFWYPHLFVESIVMLYSDIFIGSKQLIIEGEDIEDHDIDETTNIITYATYEDRIQQAEGYFQLVEDVCCNDSIKLKMVTMIIEKTFLLIYFQMIKYEKLGQKCEDIMNIVAGCLKNCINNYAIKVVSDNLDLVIEYIDSIKDSYLREWINLR